MSIGREAYTNLKSRKELVISIVFVLAMAFASLVTSSYTADHMKKSKCDMKSDASFKSAYNWATGSAIIGTLLFLAMCSTLVHIAFNRK